MAMAEARVADAPHPQSQGRSSSAAALGQPATQAMEKALAGTTNEPRARFRLKGVGARDSSAAQQGAITHVVAPFRGNIGMMGKKQE